MNAKEKSSLVTVLTNAHLNHEKKLNIHAYFKLSDHALGEDLVQDTFIKTWKYLVRGGRVEVMRSFLYNILNNLIIDEYRKRKTSSLSALMEKGFEPRIISASNLFDVLDGKALAILIKQLPQPYQKVIYMKYIQELSIAEMALLTGKSKNTITVQAHRGLAKLKLLYKF